MSKIQTLPEGCSYNGSSQIDIGQCENRLCHSNDEEEEEFDGEQTCTDLHRYCCAGK